MFATPFWAMMAVGFRRFRRTRVVAREGRSRMRAEWPLVGREGELDFARRVMRTPSLSGLVLAGRAGVGKTRLAREVLAEAEADGATVRWARATRSAAAIPLGAMAHLLPQHHSEDGRDGRDGQAGLLRAAARAIVESAGGRPLVLAVDDAAHLDDASATLVSYLCHTGDVHVVVTVESGVAVPDPIFALWKDGLAERLDIAELTRPMTDELVCATLGDHVDGEVLQSAWEFTLGNALFLREIVEGGRESGALTRTDGIWRCAGPLAPGPRLLELIETRIGALSEDERTLLELLAYGEPLGSEVLLRMGAQRVLAGAERKGLIVSERGERRLDVRLVHPIYAEAVRRQTSALRERRAYQILAGAIERTGARRATDNARIVTWRLAGGLPVDADLVRRTAMAATRVDYRQAERLARAATELDGGFAGRYLLGQVLVGAGRSGEAEDVLAALVDVAGDDDERARLAVTRVSNLYWALGEGDRARAVLAAARGSVTSVAARDELGVVHAAVLLNRGHCGEAIRLLEEPLDRPGQSGRVSVAALTTLSLALGRAGRCDDALAAAERAVGLAGRDDDPTVQWGALTLESARCAAHALAGRLDKAQTLAEEGYVRALADHWPSAKAVHASWLGFVALSRGRVTTARRWLREAATSAHPAPFPFTLALLGELAVATALAGDVPMAETLLAEAELPLAEPNRLFAPWAALAGPWVAAAAGETTRAVKLALAAADLARDRGHHHTELVALHDVVRLDAAALVLDRLRATAGTVQGALAPVYLEHGEALASSNGARLDAVAERFAELGADLLAAEAAAQAAAAHQSVGRAGSSQAAANRAHAWAAMCEGARTPALVRLRAPSDLTRRELEIAQLAASGITSRAIAERLVVSVRTVDNVLRSVYAKLGVAGRNELAAAVGLLPAAVKHQPVGRPGKSARAPAH
jgi:DNA-binding CsgD family transcriptional regulator